MSKQSMKRPEISGRKQLNQVPPVPELQGKAKHTKTPARPIIAGTTSPAQKVYHGVPHSERPIPNEYLALDNDLARDNLENDIPAADLRNC